MELQHTFTVPLPVDDAWEAFTDLERIAPCFPGAQVTGVDGDDFTGVARVKLGPVSLQYQGTGRWVERDATSHRAVIEASGKDRRGNGTAGATIVARLEAADDGTRVVVDTDLRVTGRPAQFGRGVMQDVGTKLLDQFAACLSTRLAPGGDAATDGATGTRGPAGGTVPPEPGPVPDPSPGRPTPEPPLPEPPLPGPPAPDPRPTPDPRPGPPGPQPPVPAPAPDPAVPPAPVPAPVPPPAPQRPRQPDPFPPSELDLAAVAGPVLLRRYAPAVVTTVLAALLTWWLVRRRRR